MKTIVWFRTDLRLDYNRVLERAGVLGHQVLPLFIIDLPTVLKELPANRFTFLIESLEDLDSQLQKYNSRLCILVGKPETILEQLSTPDTYILFGKRFTTRANKRDTAVLNRCKAQGAKVESIKNSVVFDLDDTILTKTNDPVKVFTAFKTKWLALLQQQPEQLQFDAIPTNFASASEIQEFLNEALKEISLEELKQYKQKTAESKDTTIHAEQVSGNFKGDAKQAQQSLGGFKGGASQAQQVWNDFKQEKLLQYKSQRDFPGINGTSKLSPHLKWGTISPHQIVAYCTNQLGNKFPDFRSFATTKLSGLETYLSELIWREFYIYIHSYFPHVEHENFLPKFDAVTWLNNEDLFEAWCNGKTGYPIVDACMRQLNTTGWMHNRGRMIVGSFLTKDLHCHWQKGEEYFRQKLIDYEQSANNGGWQWVAGTGTDASPYFRIFNPTEQSKKFDPDGVFIKTYIPELAKLPIEYIHQPSFMNPQEQEMYNCIIGKDYPHPIIDHAQERKKALELYKGHAK